MNEVIAGGKDIDNEIFLYYFKYHNPSFLVKGLIIKQDKNEKLVNNINNGLNDLRNDVSRKEIPGNKNPKKAVDIVEKVPDVSKQRKGKGLPSDLAKNIKTLTPKQMLQRLPIALAQVKAGNTSEELLNEIRQIISLYRTKEVTKKVYNNIMNSIKL